MEMMLDMSALQIFWSGFVVGSSRTIAASMMQDAAAASVDSPQIQLARGLTREASGASSDLGSTANAEAEIRRLTQVPCTLPVSAMLSFLLHKRDSHEGGNDGQSPM